MDRLSTDDMRPVRLRGIVLATAVVWAVAAPAQAQDLTHRFINPSFGGNPFYSDHLLAIATIHRPSAPEEADDTPTQEDLIAQQIQARLLAQLQGNILDQIQNAAVGDTGNFELGNQRIAFTRTATETRITFTNTTTGEVNTVVLPADTDAAAAAAAARATVSASNAAAATGSLLAARSASEQSLAGVPVTIASGRPAGSAAATAGRSAESTLLGAGNSSVLPPF